MKPHSANDRRGARTACAALAIAAAAPVAWAGPAMFTFNPVVEGARLELELDGGQVLTGWTGGGYLQRFAEGRWSTVDEQTPHSEALGGSGLFRAIDPWDGERAVTVYGPSSIEAGERLPLLVAMHGFTSSGESLESWMKFLPLVEDRRFLYVTPDGTQNALGIPFWNATDACCGFGSDVDDANYLRALIEGVARRCPVDRKRIYLVGHSNGGFMAYRMACEHADLIAGIASLAGATFKDEATCRPSEPVHVLQVHGTSDGVISYGGGSVSATYPGAVETVETWGTYNGHSARVAVPGLSLDIDSDLAGAETTVSRMTGGDPATSAAAELWTIDGGPHSPPFTRRGASTEFAERVLEWLFAHPKR